LFALFLHFKSQNFLIDAGLFLLEIIGLSVLIGIVESTIGPFTFEQGGVFIIFRVHLFDHWVYRDPRQGAFMNVGRGHHYF